MSRAFFEQSCRPATATTVSLSDHSGSDTAISLDPTVSTILGGVSGGCWVEKCVYASTDCLEPETTDHPNLDTLTRGELYHAGMATFEGSSHGGASRMFYSSSTDSEDINSTNLGSSSENKNRKLLQIREHLTWPKRTDKKTFRGMKVPRFFGPRASACSAIRTRTTAPSDGDSIAASSDVLSPSMMPRIIQNSAVTRASITDRTSISSFACSVDADEMIGEKEQDNGPEQIGRFFQQAWRKVYSSREKIRDRRLFQSLN